MNKFISIIITLGFTISCNANETEHRVAEINKIMQRAEKKWPGDYTMQRYEIAEQTEAFIEIEKMRSLMKENKLSSINDKNIKKTSAQEIKDYYAKLAEIDKNRYK